MNVIAFLSQKGGSGKTTLVVHTAVAAYEAGCRVVVVDTDPQKSASTWRDARGAAEPMVATAAPSELARVLKAARAEPVDLVIIDTAPHAAPEAAGIARIADFVIIPCRPTAFDLAAASNAAAIVKAARASAAFVGLDPTLMLVAKSSVRPPRRSRQPLVPPETVRKQAW